MRLASGRTYLITSTLRVRDGGGISGDGTATLYLPATSFGNRRMDSAGRYGPKAVGIDCSGGIEPPYTPNRDIRLEGFVLRSEKRDGRVVSGIVCRNVAGIVIERLRIVDFPVGAAIRVASIAAPARIASNQIENFTDDTDWRVAGTGSPQITGIEVDNDRVNQLNSAGLEIVDNRIANLTVGPRSLAAHGYQTDGINVVHEDTVALTIRGNVITGVGEGIDHFGSRSSLVDNTISDTYHFGIKLIHGARENIIRGNTIIDSGISGIAVHGSDVTRTPTRGNLITGNTIRGIDPRGDWAGRDTACIRVIGDHGVSNPTGNRMVGNSCDPGRGRWSLVHSTTAPAANDFIDEELKPGTSGYTAGRNFGTVLPATRTAVHAYLSSDRVISGGVKVPFDLKGSDARGEFDTTTGRWSAQLHGDYRVVCDIRYGSSGEHFVQLYKNGTPSGRASGELRLAPGDYLECVGNSGKVLGGPKGSSLDVTHAE